MRRTLCWAVIGLGMILAGVPVIAHHSFAAEYDANKPVTLKGTVTRMLWSNPHGWIYIDVKGPDGKVTNWALETGGVNALYRRGWRKEDLAAGIAVTVEGFLAKDGTPTANATNILLPDGKRLFAGSPTTPGAQGGER
jgi:hypothetical protein